MDSTLQRLYRKYQAEQTLSAYMTYYAAAKRAGSITCFVGSECPHCVMARAAEDYPAGHEIHRALLEFFSTYNLTENNTYRHLATVGENTWWSALLYILGGFGGIASNDPRLPGEFVGQGELCFGSQNPAENAGEYGYGFNHWPPKRLVEGRDGWIKHIHELEESTGASFIEVEVIPHGSERTKPELGPINFNASILSFLRLTFLDAEQEPTSQFETLFITSIPVSWSADPYGHDWHRDHSIDDVDEGARAHFEGKMAWECPGCTLWVMTDDGLHPNAAGIIYISCGSFSSRLWHHWTHEEYLKRVLAGEHPGFY